MSFCDLCFVFYQIPSQTRIIPQVNKFRPIGKWINNTKTPPLHTSAGVYDYRANIPDHQAAGLWLSMAKSIVD